MEEEPQREGITQGYSLIPTFEPEPEHTQNKKISIEVAFQKCGGFGRF